MNTVIFACVHNAGRSQMAAAFFNGAVDPNKVKALSAGTDPGECVHAEVIEAMLEVGIDLTHERPRRLTQKLADRATILVTMGCGDQCPILPGIARDDWLLDDPKDKPLARVREIRDEVRRHVAELVAKNSWQRRTR